MEDRTMQTHGFCSSFVCVMSMWIPRHMKSPYHLQHMSLRVYTRTLPIEFQLSKHDVTHICYHWGTSSLQAACLKCVQKKGNINHQWYSSTVCLNRRVITQIILLLILYWVILHLSKCLAEQKLIKKVIKWLWLKGCDRKKVLIIVNKT